jgi:putative ABC transport system substrate-binding protein
MRWLAIALVLAILAAPLAAEAQQPGKPSRIVYLGNTPFIEFAQKQRIPTAGQTRRFVHLGGLVYFGADSAHLFGRIASYVDRILKGAKPADLPIGHPTKFEFFIHLKTAKALGLTIPPSLLQRADQVIE